MLPACIRPSPLWCASSVARQRRSMRRPRRSRRATGQAMSIFAARWLTASRAGSMALHQYRRRHQAGARRSAAGAISDRRDQVRLVHARRRDRCGVIVLVCARSFDFGWGEIAGRFDSFDVEDQSFVAVDNQNEVGPAVTLSLGRQLAPNLLGRLELMQIDSDRPARADAGWPVKDQQTVFQTSLKVDF
jgi:hypothetical protein